MTELSLNVTSDIVNTKDSSPIWERRCDLQGQVLKAGWTFNLIFNYYNGTYHNINNGQQHLTGVNYEVAQSLANRCNFSMRLEEFDAYGTKQNNGSWTGIVGKLINNELDIGIADLSVTTGRRDVIDFSVGIINTEFLLFMQKPENGLQGMRETFIEVISNRFWFCLITSIFSLSITLFMIKMCDIGMLNNERTLLSY